MLPSSRPSVAGAEMPYFREYLRDGLRPFAGREVLMGVRPEHVGEAGAHDWRNTAPLGGTIEIVETIGHEVIVTSAPARTWSSPSSESTVSPGEQVSLVMNCDAIHLFDPQTEQRLPG